MVLRRSIDLVRHVPGRWISPTTGGVVFNPGIGKVQTRYAINIERCQEHGRPWQTEVVQSSLYP